jgi:hypothetical protein
MIDAAVAQVQKEFEAKQPKNNHDHQVMLRAANVSTEVKRSVVKTILNMTVRPNREVAFQMLAEQYREYFKSWSKDDLVYITSLAHSAIIVDALNDIIV